VSVDIVDHADLLGEELNHDPYPYFARLRSSQPVAWNSRHRAWLITRHEDVHSMLRDARLSSDTMTPYFTRRLSAAQQQEMAATFGLLNEWMVFRDPPEHTRLRKVVMGTFRARRVEEMRTYSTEIARQTMRELWPPDDRGAGRVVDLQNDFAENLPATTILELLGIPVADRKQFAGWVDEMGTLINGVVSDPDRSERANVAVTAMVGYLRDLIASGVPQQQDNLLAELLHAAEDGERLTESEVIATSVLLLDAGFKNTVRLISNALYLLLRHPDQFARLRAGEISVADVVEETLRFEGPGKLLVRFAREDIVLHDVTIPAGQRVFLVNASANRDGEVFADADEFRPHPQPPRNLAFGHGLHTCLGASLARMQATVAITEAITVLGPEARLVAEPEWQPALLSRNFSELKVVVDPRGPAAATSEGVAE
jgi:cytochrome P450